MPIFEYACKKCGKVSEIIMRAQTTPVCEHCGSKSVEKILSTFSAHQGGQEKSPPCAGGCGGFGSGACGSGMCCGH